MENNKSVGATVGIVIIVLLLVAGGIYFFVNREVAPHIPLEDVSVEIDETL